jgi:hypothetical protein
MQSIQHFFNVVNMAHESDLASFIHDSIPIVDELGKDLGSTSIVRSILSRFGKLITKLLGLLLYLLDELLLHLLCDTVVQHLNLRPSTFGADFKQISPNPFRSYTTKSVRTVPWKASRRLAAERTYLRWRLMYGRLSRFPGPNQS